MLLGFTKQQIFPNGYTSYSQLESFKRCPLYFKLRYIQKIKGPENYYASFGKAIHKVFEEDGLNQKQKNCHLTREQLIAIYNEYWEKNDMGFPDEHKKREYYIMGLQMIEVLLQRPVQEIIAVEKEFLLDLPSLIVPVRGVIDKIYLDDSNSGFVVTDYKTGKPKSQEEIDTSLQVSLYGVVVRRLYGDIPVRYEFDFPRENLVLPTYRTRHDLVRTICDINGSIEEMLSDEFVRRCDSRWWCKNLCEMTQLGACK